MILFFFRNVDALGLSVRLWRLFEALGDSCHQRSHQAYKDRAAQMLCLESKYIQSPIDYIQIDMKFILLSVVIYTARICCFGVILFWRHLDLIQLSSRKILKVDSRQILVCKRFSVGLINPQPNFKP